MTFFLTLVYAIVYLAYCINEQQFGGKSYTILFWLGFAILVLLNSNIAATKRMITHNLMGRLDKLEEEVAKNSDDYGILDENGNIVTYADSVLLLSDNDKLTLSLTMKDCNELLNYSRNHYYKLMSKQADISYRYKIVGDYKRVAKVTIEDFKSSITVEIDKEEEIDNFFTMLIKCKNVILEKIDKDDTHV